MKRLAAVLPLMQPPRTSFSSRSVLTAVQECIHEGMCRATQESDICQLGSCCALVLDLKFTHQMHAINEPLLSLTESCQQLG